MVMVLIGWCLKVKGSNDNIFLIFILEMVSLIGFFNFSKLWMFFKLKFKLMFVFIKILL